MKYFIKELVMIMRDKDWSSIHWLSSFLAYIKLNNLSLKSILWITNGRFKFFTREILNKSTFQSVQLRYFVVERINLIENNIKNNIRSGKLADKEIFWLENLLTRIFVEKKIRRQENKSSGKFDDKKLSTNNFKQYNLCLRQYNFFNLYVLQYCLSQLIYLTIDTNDTINNELWRH